MMVTRDSRSPPRAPDRPAARAGMTLEQYNWRVRDMAKNVVHVPALYVLALVAGLTRLLPHPFFEDPGGWWSEAIFFVCGYLGAWAVLYSALLRDAGLRSWTATFVVPLAALVAAAIWIALPAPAEMSAAQAAWAAALLAGPGPLAWAVTMRRWRIEKRRVAHMLLPATGDGGGES